MLGVIVRDCIPWDKKLLDELVDAIDKGKGGIDKIKLAACLLACGLDPLCWIGCYIEYKIPDVWDIFNGLYDFLKSAWPQVSPDCCVHITEYVTAKYGRDKETVKGCCDTNWMEIALDLTKFQDFTHNLLCCYCHESDYEGLGQAEVGRVEHALQRGWIV
jgi:hypothetical protein